MKYFILVTGASSGIGESACRALLEEGYHVLATVRTALDRDRLKYTYGPAIYPLIMDVADTESVQLARVEVEAILGSDPLVAIINNAGFVISGAVLYIPVTEWHRLFEVNVYGVLRTTQIFFPLLARPKLKGDEHPRRIINMSSVSGLFASPFIGPYASSKYALEAMSDSLRRELYMYDIQVVLLEPGNVLTPIWEKAKASTSYFGPEYDSILEFKNQFIDRNIRQGIQVKLVDEVLIRAIRNKKVKIRYLIRPQKWKFRLITMLPAKWVDGMIRNRLIQRSGIRPF